MEEEEEEEDRRREGRMSEGGEGEGGGRREDVERRGEKGRPIKRGEEKNIGKEGGGRRTR